MLRPTAWRTTLTCLFALTLSAVVSGEIVHVSPNGSDTQGNGSQEAPFRTLKHAVVIANPQDIVELGPGIYSPETTGEPFPITLPVVENLTLRGPSAGAAVIRDVNGGSGKARALLEFLMRGSRETIELRLENLEIEGGLSGVSVVGELNARFEVAIAGCRWGGQGFQGLEVVVGPGGFGRVRLQSNRFHGGPAFGIDLGTQPKAVLEVEMTDNLIEADAKAPSEGAEWAEWAPPRYGVALWQDSGAQVKATIDRNTFLGVPVGVLFLQTSIDAEAGSLEAVVSSCVIAGGGGNFGKESPLLHGFHLGLWSQHRSAIRLLHNTVVHARGFAVHEEQPEVPAAEEANLDLRIAGNLFWNLGQGEFSAETGDRPLPAHYREVAGNLLPSSRLQGRDGNISADPLLGSSFEPGAGSPILDAYPFATDLLLDRQGRCRAADADGDGIYRADLGAFEAVGPCAGESLPFVRGDCDRDQNRDISDPVRMFEYLFLGGAPISCADACDTNDDGEIDIADGIFTLGYLFLGGVVPPEPSASPGVDPTPDQLGLCK